MLVDSQVNQLARCVSKYVRIFCFLLWIVRLCDPVDLITISRWAIFLILLKHVESFANLSLHRTAFEWSSRGVVQKCNKIDKNDGKMPRLTLILIILWLMIIFMVDKKKLLKPLVCVSCESKLYRRPMIFSATFKI